jgi:hypothetical protein
LHHIQTHKSQQFRNVLQNPVDPGPSFTWLLRAAHFWFNQVKSLLGVKKSLLSFTQFTQACPPMELDCTKSPYLPPPDSDGFEFIANKEAAILDRHFRLMREDMVGSLRQELADEIGLKPAAHTLLFRSPALVDIDFKVQTRAAPHPQHGNDTMPC